MIYIFTFLGEFGYELLNWQGVVRKFSESIGPSDRIVCCSRMNLYPLYEAAALYIDISEIKLFKNSQACCYWAVTPGTSSPGSWRNLALDWRLRTKLKSFISKRLELNTGEWIREAAESEIVFVFSSSKTRLGDCTFGCEPNLQGRMGDIYERLDLTNNLYKKIESDLQVQRTVERQIGFDLSEPYILMQTRTRPDVVRSHDVVPKDELISALSEMSKVVLLSFNSGRKLDSFSSFEASLGCVHYTCPSYLEQACLIHFAKRCVFFTEGDFGSHIYIPPFMGKDVIAIAPQNIFGLGTTPIDFWNRNVFCFGGQIIPKIAEDVFASRKSVLELADEVVSY